MQDTASRSGELFGREFGEAAKLDWSEHGANALSDTIPANIGTTATIDPRSTTSSVEFGWVNAPGDADWYRMPVVAGERYTIIISGYSSSGGGPALPSPTVRVYDAGGQLLGSSGSVNGTSASYQLTPAASGFVFVSAEGSNGSTGRYSTLVVTSAAPPADSVPGDVSTSASVAVGGAVEGAIDTAGDKDWFRVQLTAGVIYEFSLNATGASTLDPLLQLRDASGGLLAQNDDFGDGLDSRLTFRPETSGTFYLSAADFDAGTGRYRLTAAVGTVNDIRTTLDWGTRVGGDVVKVFFIPAGETHDGQVSEGWNDYEIGRVFAALQLLEDVTRLDFVRVSDPLAADFRLMTTNGLEDGELGSFTPPGEPGAGLGVFARNGDGWAEEGGGGLEFGGRGFITLVHEFAHGLGLAHPHDTGGRSTVMTGVNEPFGSYGLFGLNQGVFTTMGYNEGWATGPDGRSRTVAFGREGGPMALDIAVLQAKYGANLGHRTGNDLYLLPAADGLGVGYQAIWDAGGVDTIEHRAGSAAVIDLRPATIDYSPTGGGAVSFVRGVHGGFTVAAGAAIENALGGSGADEIRGNDLGNLLAGREGDDVVFGGGGGDHLLGGAGRDAVHGEQGDDLAGGEDGDDFMDGGAGRDTFFGDAGGDHMIGGTDADRLFGGDGDDLIGGQDGDDFIDGGFGRDVLYGDAGGDHMVGGAEGDRLFGGDGDDLIGGQDGDDFIDGGFGRDLLFGDAGADHIVGGAQDDGLFGQDGDDLMGGQDGADLLDGGSGRDALYGDSGDDRLVGGAGDDRLDGGAGLDTAVFRGGRAGYAVTTRDGVFTVTGADGIDVLFGVEQLQFDDGLVVLSGSAPLGSGDEALRFELHTAAPDAPAWAI